MIGWSKTSTTALRRALLPMKATCQGPPTVVVRADDCRWEGCAKHRHFETLAHQQMPSFAQPP